LNRIRMYFDKNCKQQKHWNMRIWQSASSKYYQLEKMINILDIMVGLKLTQINSNYIKSFYWSTITQMLSKSLNDGFHEMKL